MPHCNNMSLRRTKSKGTSRVPRDISETLVQNCHGRDGSDPQVRNSAPATRYA